jgi:hypothetical protein
MDCLQGQERVFRLSAYIRRLGSAVSLEGLRTSNIHNS